MEFLIAIIALALLVVVILVISAPLRAVRGQQNAKPEEARAELEAAREAKYREIRDAQLDYNTGKLSQEDFAATDGALRAEAVEILDWLDALEKEEDAVKPGGPTPKDAVKPGGPKPRDASKERSH